jgi:hypothetical protein
MSMNLIIEKAKDFLMQNNIQLDLEENNEFETVACYIQEKNIIYINSSMLIKESEQSGLSWEDYLIIIMAHEIGHHLDVNLSELMIESNKQHDELYAELINGFDMQYFLQLIKEREVNAWQNGRRFIPEHLKYQNELLNRGAVERRIISVSKNIVDDLIKEVNIQREMINQLLNEIIKQKQENQAP